MKKLIVTGFPCPKEPWIRMFGEDNVGILDFATVISLAKSPDLRSMASIVDSFISDNKPEHIIAHDVGVATSLIALFSRRKRGDWLPIRVTLFNGSFNEFDVFKATHPFRIQLKTWNGIKREVGRVGVSPDEKLQDFLPLIKKMYREIILFSLLQRVKKLSTSTASKSIRTLAMPSLIIEGRNDPYIPKESMDSLQSLFQHTRRVEAYEGHFPYLGDVKLIKSIISDFENTKP